MYTAFSRDGPKKVYVQHLIKEHAAEVSSLLERTSGGYFYVCGDAANMAREVNVLLGQIFAQERNIPESKAEIEVKSMRSSNKYQEDVWS
jgi:NADPH-ferrihemoprotein reductase